MIGLEIANGQPLFWDSADGNPLDQLNPDPLDNRSSTVWIGWGTDGQPLVAGFDQHPGGRDLEFQVAGIAQPTTLWVDLPFNTFELLLPDVPIDLAWAPDGRRLAVAYQETIEIIDWSVGTGVNRQILAGHRGDILGLEWSWLGDALASYSLDGSVIIWPINP
jgi:WD40 repeat protein